MSLATMSASNPNRPTLHALPTEIIKRIATFLPCPSAHALMRTSCQFYLSVNDRLVFRAMLENQRSQDNHDPLAASWIARLPGVLPPSCPPAAWARFALADAKAAAVAAAAAAPAPFEWHAFLAWAPPLLLLHHPLLCSPRFFAELPSRVLTRLSAGLDLVVSLLVLQHGVTHLLDLSQRCQTFGHIAALKTRLLRFGKYTGVGSGGEGGAVHAVFMCALVEWLHACARVGQGPPSVWPPSAADIPFSTFVDLPLPFSGSGGSGGGGKTFQSCHLRTMTSATFLEDGRWTAYYSLTTVFPSRVQPLFQPPVIDIQFTARPRSGAEPELLELRAAGADHAGPFTAVGSLRADGRMEMLETNWRGQKWLWSLQMMPIGLFGTWGTSDDTHGFLWMFKEAWCHKPARR